MIRRPPRSTQSRSSAASDVYKRQQQGRLHGACRNRGDDQNRERHDYQNNTEFLHTAAFLTLILRKLVAMKPNRLNTDRNSRRPIHISSMYTIFSNAGMLACVTPHDNPVLLPADTDSKLSLIHISEPTRLG